MLHSFRFEALPRLGEAELRQGEVVHLCEGGFRLGKPKGSLVGEVLPRLSEGVLFLGEPEVTARCCFPTVLYIVHDGF